MYTLIIITVQVKGRSLFYDHVRSVGRGVERVKKSPLRLGLPHLVPSGSDEIVSHTAGSPGAPAFVTRFSRTCHFRRNLLSCRVFTIIWWMWLYTVPPLTTPLENKVLRTLLCHGTSISVLESSYWYWSSRQNPILSFEGRRKRFLQENWKFSTPCRSKSWMPCVLWWCDLVHFAQDHNELATIVKKYHVA